MALDTHYGRARADAEGAQEGLLRSQFPPQDVTSYPSHKEIGHSTLAQRSSSFSKAKALYASPQPCVPITKARLSPCSVPAPR